MRGYYRHVRRRASLPVAPGVFIACLDALVAFTALVVLLASPNAARAAAPTRVGLADVGHGAASHAALGALRARLEGRPDLALPKETAREALEAPLADVGVGAEADATLRPRARELVRAARDAYSRFEYDVALERLRQAELALATAPPAPELTQLLVEVNLLVGVLQVDRGDLPHALDAFRTVQRLEPARRKLDAGRYRPRAVALYAQAAAAPETRGSRISVVTEPAGAEVWIDGARAGTAPFTAPLGAGVHYVSAVAPGSTPRLEKPLLRPGEDTRLSLMLARSPPEARVRESRVALATPDAAPEASSEPAAPSASPARPWATGAAALAAGASLDVLVLVRDANGGVTAEAAVYDARTGALGAWTAATPVEPVLAALALALVPPPPAERLVSGAGATHGSSRPPTTAWYRSWWVVPPLLAVGAATALGTLWIIDRERTTTYAVNRWCFDRTCAP
jgi:hypothetical protein